MALQRVRSLLGWQWAAPVACAVLLAALMGAGLLRNSKPQTASQVREEIHSIVLGKSEDSTWDDGGIIGPWHVAATSLDEITGDLLDFRLRSGSINLGATRARLLVDIDRNTFSFRLQDVVILQVPAERDVQSTDNHLIRLDSFILGPAKYHRPIVRDEAAIRPGG